MKQCRKCLQLLELTEYHIKRDASDGLRKECKQCRSIDRKSQYSLNRDYEKAICKNYSLNNKKKVTLKNKLWSQNNKSYIALKEKTRRHEDINYRLIGNLRKRLNHALNKNQKTGSAINELGCSIEELKVHLESQFEPWMNWSNYGRYNSTKKTWNIDHVKPLIMFDLTKPDQLSLASHYTNLQPMLAKDNFSKGAKYEQS